MDEAQQQDDSIGKSGGPSVKTELTCAYSLANESALLRVCYSITKAGTW